MPGSRWTKPQIEALIDQIVNEKKPLPELVIAGKSRAAINNQRKRLQHAGVLNGAFPGRAVRPWTVPELKRLTGFTQEYGFSASFIAQMKLLPDRSKDSISKMMGRHGLGNAAVKERSRRARRLDPPERAELRQFLLEEGRLAPSIEVARRWGIAQKTVTAYRRGLGIRLSWEEARASEEFQRQQRKSAASLERHTRERWRQWRERKRHSWEKLREELRRGGHNIPPRICEVCGEQWYATREFYHVRMRRGADGITIGYCRTCRLCRAEQRRGRAKANAGDTIAPNVSPQSGAVHSGVSVGAAGR
jgi:hypothetical protein